MTITLTEAKTLFIGLAEEPQLTALATAYLRQLSARDSAKNIPNWAAWSEAEAQTWGNTNIGTPLANARSSLPATLTLATARAAFVVLLNILDSMWVLLWALTRMVLALRNAQWPDIGQTTAK
jgi:hypothetical protein